MHTQETSIYYALLGGIVVLLFLTAFFMISITRYHRRKVEHEFDNLNRHFNYLEAEKARISLDFHDDLGSLITAARFHLQSIKGSDRKEQQKILKAESLIGDIMQKLRIISHNLMPTILQRKGLRAALHELAINTMSVSDIKIQFDSTPLTLMPQVEVHVYRIVQEILTNAIKHSAASKISINAVQRGQKFSLVIRDDGKGFKKKEVWQRLHRQGLLNIMNRVDMIGGDLYLNTMPGMGVEYQLKLQAHGRQTNQNDYRR